MVTPLLLGYLLLGSQKAGELWKKVFLNMPPKAEVALMFQGPVDPLDPPKASPKKFGFDKLPWEFPWMLEGFTQTSKTGMWKAFRVFAQEQKGDRATQVVTMQLRMWNMNFSRLRLVHNPEYNGGLVETYLCFGGKAGGEQLFDVDIGTNVRTGKKVDVKVNTIYIYDMPSFTDPVEMAREVAHEYGHATLPPIGGFGQPEEWADGYLGERLYLKWAREEMEQGSMAPSDVMGATKEGLDKWLAANVDALIVKSSLRAPSESLVTDKSKEGMDYFLGTALLVDTLFGDSVFTRSIKMTGSLDAKDFLASAVLAVEEPEELEVHVPPYLVGKAFWIPLGSAKLKGAVWLNRQSNGWVQIQPKNPTFTISNIH